MNVGVIARSEPRGLGYQTVDVSRHVRPAKVLLVEPSPARWPTNREWFADYPTTILTWPTGTGPGQYKLDENTVRSWLDGLDVVYSAETLYDWRIASWAADAGVSVVVHANPELLDPAGRATPGVVWWAPTPWLLDRLPDGTVVVPMPVDVDLARPVPETDGPIRYVHVGGHAAHLDRNGTRLLATTIRNVRGPCELLVTGQDGRLPDYLPRSRQRVKLRVAPRGLPDRFDAYVGDVLVLPRKYGGLCLPAQEAMACGMCVLLTDISPNQIWPGPRVSARSCGERLMLGGYIPVCEPDPVGLRGVLDYLAVRPEDVARHKADSVAWAASNSWDVLASEWAAQLAKAADR